MPGNLAPRATTAPSGATPFAALAPSDQISVRIGEAILAAIEEGAFPPGSRLPGEVELARQFGVSRPTVREALSALVFAGYVRPRRGAPSVVVGTRGEGRRSARPILRSPRDALDVFESRLAVEPQALFIAALDPEPRALEEAGDLIRGMGLAVDAPVFHASTDLRMHAALVAVCRNRFLAEESLRLLDLCAEPVLGRARERAWSTPELPRLWVGHHVAVYEAIAAGDAEGAARVACRHLCSTVLNVVEALGLETADPRVRALLDRAGAGEP